MKNKILFVAFLLMASVSAWGQTWFVIDSLNLKFTVIDEDNKYVSVEAAETKPEGDLVIPSTVENWGTYTVTNIGENAFSRCQLTTVVIPGSVNKIDGYAFAESYHLASVIMEEGLTTIGNFAFGNCTGLTSVIIPNSVKNIEGYAFFWCRLKSITLPDSLISIGEYAFYSCEMDSLIIPNSVENIGINAFAGCHITKTKYSSIESFFRIKNAPATKQLYIAGKEITDLVVPKFVTSINSYAFKEIESLTSVIIGDSVESIGDNAFLNCSNLVSVTLGKSLKSIGDYAFCNCSNLASVTCGNSLENIGKAAFANCSNLASVTFDKSLKNIGNEAFWFCSNLKSINIPDAVTKIDTSAFYGCNLTSVVIPNSVDTISPYAFYLTKNIVYSGNAEGSPWGAITVNGIIDGDFVYSDAEKTQLSAYIGEDIKSVTIPESVTSIGEYAFVDCDNLITVIIPNTVKTISKNAFAGCTATIKCIVEERPEGWDSDWLGYDYKARIFWGYIPTSVTEPAANAVNIYANVRSIVVENAAEEIRVYDAMGRMVGRDAINRVRTEICLNTPGLYIVKVGDVAKRVMVK